MELTKINLLAINLKLSRRLNDLTKRGFDILVSAVVLILLAPVFGLIGWAIKRDSPGPAFYRGMRTGRNGEPFQILKFRTMYERPESYQGPRVTAQDDTRVTRLGHWLRETKLNELPQFWNVLKGEMSLVGPRPEDPHLARTWPRDVWAEVLSVRPGITSPASVQYRNEETLLSTGSVMQKYLDDLAPDKMRLDQLYVRNRSLWLDLDVLVWTVLVVLPKIGAHTPPEQMLFVGPATRLFHRYMRWFVLDLLVTFFAIGLTGLIWRADAPLNVGWPRAIAGAIGFSLLFSLTGALMGMNRVAWSQASNSDVFGLFPAWFVATLIGFFANLYLDIFPASLILMASGLALVGFVVVRYRRRLFYGLLSYMLRYRGAAASARERVLIVGSGPPAQLANWLLTHPDNASRYWIVGAIEDDLYKQGMRIFGMPVLGTCNDLTRLIAKYDVGVVLLTDQRIVSDWMPELLQDCRATSARLVVLPDIFAALNGAGLDSEPAQAIDPVDKNLDLNTACLRCLIRDLSSMAEKQAVPASDAGAPDVQTPAPSSTQSTYQGI